MYHPLAGFINLAEFYIVLFFTILTNQILSITTFIRIMVHLARFVHFLILAGI